MKTASVLIRSVVLGLCLLSANAFAGYFFTSVSSSSGPHEDGGTVYNVPSGANFEWNASGYFQLGINGGGLAVDLFGSGGGYADAGNTTVSGNVDYYMNASNGEALLYIGW